MASVHDVSKQQSRLSQVLTTDFCPWANRFVYWLKEPIGWFVVATAISCIIGLYFSPVGWSLAVALVSIIVVGMAWPLVAVHATLFELIPDSEAVHEDESCRMIVRVRNRIPVPVWGLVVEGYLDGGPSIDREGRIHEHSEEDDPSEPLPTVGLASVPPMCQASYGISIQPSLRGHYPRQQPTIACSFPFGIWTARRPLTDVKSLTVWPKIYSTRGLAKFSDDVAAEMGSGGRSGREGDINGVRDYRRGDSAKHVHWVASARTDSLMITERSAPQTAEVEVRLDTSLGRCGSTELSRRIRIAASIIAALREQNLPLNVQFGKRSMRIPQGNSAQSKVAFRTVLNEMATIPIEGTKSTSNSAFASCASITITGCDSGSEVIVFNPTTSRRLGTGVDRWQVRKDEDLTAAMHRFWQEIGHADNAA